MQWLVQGTTSYLLKKTEESISNIINAPPGSTERPQQQQPVAHQQSGSGAVASGQPKWHCHARHSDHGSQLAIRVLTVAEQWLDQWDITWCTGGILILSLWRPSPRRKMRKRSLLKTKSNWRTFFDLSWQWKQYWCCDPVCDISYKVTSEHATEISSLTTQRLKCHVVLCWETWSY